MLYNIYTCTCSITYTCKCSITYTHDTAHICMLCESYRLRGYYKIVYLVECVYLVDCVYLILVETSVVVCMRAHTQIPCMYMAICLQCEDRV